VAKVHGKKKTKAHNPVNFITEQGIKTKNANKKKYQYSDLVEQPSDMSHLRKPSLIA